MLTPSFHFPVRAIPRSSGFALETCQLHQFAEALGNAVDARDAATFHHSEEVAVVSQMLARALGQSPDQAEMVHLAGHLHDIGKIGIPDVVLKKQGPLSPEEWDWMRHHPGIGAAIVNPVDAFRRHGIADMILCHHERFDGKGYPCRLIGANIPLGARIIAVADTLSALLQDRPYRQRTDLAAACAEIRRCSGTQFDPLVVLALESIMDEVKVFFNTRATVNPAHLTRSLSGAEDLGLAIAGKRIFEHVHAEVGIHGIG